MSLPPAASVIVVSRHRPGHLALCLKALALQDHPHFEVIVVADPSGLAVAADLPVKRVGFDAANISAARNAGIVAASGEILAFIDDDAVAEPTWLSRLTAPLADPEIAAAGGFVRGRNGISFQWRARLADLWGEHADIAVDPAVISLHRGQPGRAVRTEGTNCAFRREVLAAAGGFDPAYRFYLDDTDVNLRLAATGAVIALVPGAVVQHGFAASARRAPDRAPLNLFDIGASSAVFWRRHAEGFDPGPARERLHARERARALRHMVAGGIEPGEVAGLLATLEAGLSEGATRPLAALPPLPGPAEGFLPYPGTGPRLGLFLAGRRWQARRLRAAAAQAVAQGRVATLLLVSPDTRPHRMQFRPEGFWEQTGGLFGRSDRFDPAFRIWSFAARRDREVARIASDRPVAQHRAK